MNQPYGVNFNFNPVLTPRCEIPVFKDRSEAMNYPMGTNSSIIGMDSEKNVVWIVKTGPNGEKVICDPYILGDPYVPEPEPDVRSMDKKIGSIEDTLSHLIERFDKFEELIK